MEAEFWHGAWEKQQIGFHNSNTNPYLMKFWPTLNLGSNTAVFVPLAGKSVDIYWLAEQGHQVFAIELSEIAVRAFFDEHGLTPNIEQVGGLSKWVAENITFYCGDFFALTTEHLGEISAVYDRAAMVALPFEMRQQYVAHLGKLMPSGAQTLLIVFDYDQSKMSGPPFSISREEIDLLYSADFSIDHLQTRDILSRAPMFASRDFTEFNQAMYRLERR